jgi:hypothetical protein
LRQAARDFRKHRDQNDLIKPHTDGSGSKLHTDPGCKSQSQTKSEPKERWDPSQELDMNLKKTPPSGPSSDQASPVQEQSISSSASRMYLKQFHAWQLFI